MSLESIHKALSEMEEREKAATPEPMVRIRYDHGGGRMYQEKPDGGRNLVLDAYEEPDREFYFQARQDLPKVRRALLVALRDLANGGAVYEGTLAEIYSILSEAP